MNVHESDRMTAQLEAAGHKRTDTDSDAQIIIYNTCCIRNTAEQKIISHIGEAGKLKKKNPDIIVCVVGCLSQRLGSAAALRQKFPFIDIILGTHNIDNLVGAIEKVLKNKKKVIEILEQRLSNGGLVHTHPQGDVSYVNITYGCENFCAYCIVPFVRGKLICRDIADIEAEFKQIINTNPGKTIFLLGQNVNSYICPRTGTDFVGLIDKLCAIPGDFKLNFLSSHPKDFSVRLVDAIARNPKVERNIHLPLQSGCDKILALMNRGYTVAEYIKKINYLRARVPDVHITTDIICGFPTETEADFKKTIETIRQIKFNAAFIFPYSRRSGTQADKMDGQVDIATKKRRATELIRIQREISRFLVPVTTNETNEEL